MANLPETVKTGAEQVFSTNPAQSLINAAEQFASNGVRDAEILVGILAVAVIVRLGLPALVHYVGPILENVIRKVETMGRSSDFGDDYPEGPRRPIQPHFKEGGTIQDDAEGWMGRKPGDRTRRDNDW